MDVHHVELRSEGGGHVPSNLVTVCGAHHRALHCGELFIERDDSGGLLFLHADGSVYGGVANPQTIDMMAKLFSALRGLGFREGEARRALEGLRRRDDLRAASIQEWLRAALRVLSPRGR